MRTLYLSGFRADGCIVLTGIRSLAVSPLARWNSRQAQTLARLARLYRLTLSPEDIQQLATKYAAKHPRERDQIVTWGDVDPSAGAGAFWSYPPEREEV
jgi:hypothetical protein